MVIPITDRASLDAFKDRSGEASRVSVLIDRSDVGSGWATETTATTETATPIIERISIRLHQLSAMPKASQRLLDDSAFDVEGLAGRQDR